MLDQGTLTEGDGSVQFDPPIKVPCFVTKVNNIFSIKMSRPKLVRKRS